MAPQRSAFGRLVDHFHTHPQGRLHEGLFWGGIGLVIAAVAVWGYVADWMGDAFVLMALIIAACFVGFALLPRPKRKAPPPLPKGKRGEIAKKVQASKAEKKKKGPPPPGPPIRRG